MLIGKNASKRQTNKYVNLTLKLLHSLVIQVEKLLDLQKPLSISLWLPYVDDKYKPEKIATLTSHTIIILNKHLLGFQLS